jgi:hypothetical protein
MSRPETIIAAAVRRGLPYLDAEQANDEVLKLHERVGELENSLAAVARNCAGGRTWCALVCAGRAYCATQWPTVPGGGA